ncbi:DinB family protein [Flavihumibacter fluvii]|uniref:DinB family protein n=1 Tax=Flavihumibacter fluvii TaxID=2838157 RepID=UPI001BDE4735|nr:DinB family protein [Flavihumibacter fluvii]ULQ53913.1 DinB family protein [Flavihumibacter fluvii]
MISALTGEFKQELANTRKILERVPQAHFAWKPHEKSMSLLRLASHIADMARWATFTFKYDGLDFSGDYPKVPQINTNADLIAFFDQVKEEALATLEQANDADLKDNWTLRNGDQVIFTMPKGVVLRSMVFNHIIHHRGQLTVYLRLLDVPVPGLYGPSADER